MLKFIFSFLLAGYSLGLLAQSPLPVLRQPVVLVGTPAKTIISPTDADFHSYSGRVKFQHEGMTLFCDRARHQVTTGKIDAGGHVLIVQDSTTIKSDSIQYDGISRQATLSGHVILQDRNTILTTARLDYDLSSGLGRYTGKSRITTGSHMATGRDGWYSSRTRSKAPPVAAEAGANPFAPATGESVSGSATSLSSAPLPAPPLPGDVMSRFQSYGSPPAAAKETPAHTDTVATLLHPPARSASLPQRTEPATVRLSISAQNAPTKDVPTTLPPVDPTLTADTRPYVPVPQLLTPQVTITPEKTKILTVDESVSTPRRFNRHTSRSTLTVTPPPPADDVSELERVLNRKRSVH